MAKIKISILVEVEYEPNAEHYAAGSTLEEMLALDLAGAEADPYMTLDSAHAKWTISGEVVQ